MDRFKQGLKDAAAAVPKNKDSATEAKDEFAKTLAQFDSLSKLEEKTGRKREEIVGGAIAGFLGLMCLSIFIKPLGILMTRIFGFAYPCYKSFKALESDEKDDDTQWLTYWTIYGVFALMEETIFKSAESYMPVFFVWKIIFLMWCYLPQTHGAELLYTEVVGPQLRLLEEKIRESIEKNKKE
jgi:receptor expression-enhancing protein 5/6